MKVRTALPPAAGPLLLALLASASGPRLQATKSDAQTRADIDFARGLAQRFQYVDLAEKVLGDLEASKPSKELTVELGLATCDVYYEAARRESDSKTRAELFDKAMSAYEAFLAANPYSEQAPQAQRSYVDLCNTYALALDIDLQDAVGDEADAIKKKMTTVLDKGIDKTGELIDAYGNPDELSASDKEDLYRLMLNRGQLFITKGKVSESGVYSFTEADTILENLALKVGETSGWGLNAYLLETKSKLAQGLYDEAADYASFVVDVVVPSDPKQLEFQGWKDIPQELKQARWEMVERATPDLIEAYSQAGKTQDAVNWGLSAYNKWKLYGFDITPRGYLALISLGNALVDAGGWVGGSTTAGNLAWFESEDDMHTAGFSSRRDSRRAIDFALSIAQDVNQKNKGNRLQLSAQKLIRRIRDVPGVQLDPGVLYEAAEGTYFEAAQPQNNDAEKKQGYGDAIDSLKGVALALESQDEATQREYMPKVLYYLAQSYARLDRELEASLTYREAVANWAGDPEYDSKNAKRYYDTILRVRGRASGDQLIENLYLESERYAQKYSANEGDITWRQAERTYGEKDYSGARDKYLQVEAGSDFRERAIAKAALCLYKMGDKDRARDEFARYVDVYVKDPANTPSTSAAVAARSQALAQSTYYLGFIALQDQDYDEVIKRFTGFEERFPGQTSYAANAAFMLLKAHLAKQDVDAAKKVFASMHDEYPEENVTGDAALLIFRELSKMEEKARTGGDLDASIGLQRQMAEMMHISNDLAADPGWDNLRRETVLWLGLADWQKAEAAARKTLDVFGKDPSAETKANLDKFVLPDLGHALLKEKRLQEAFDVLDKIVPDPDAEDKGSASAVEDWCLAVCGWVEGDGNSIVEVPGVGDKDRYAKAAKHWFSLIQRAEAVGGGKYTCDWYQVKFDEAYCYYRWGQIDSQYLAICEGRISRIADDLTDPEMKSIAEKCGNDTLRHQFLWLLSKVR